MAVEPLLSPVVLVVDFGLAMLVLLVAGVFVSVDCENAIPTVSSTMQITDNIFLIFLYVDS